MDYTPPEGENIEIPDENSPYEVVEKYLQSYVENFLRGSLSYLKKCRLNIDPEEGTTWFASFEIFDSVPSIFYWLYVFVIKADDIKICWIPIQPSYHPESYIAELGYKKRQFPVLHNLEGKFNPMTWLYDVTGDGFDDIINVFDHLDNSPEPTTMDLKIAGYDRDKEKFIRYLNISTVILDMETGPEPVQYVQNQNIGEFRCLVQASEWWSMVWDEELKKYVKK